MIGGGDTGSDCVGTSNRHGARSILQIELLPLPPKDRTPDMPWPTYPRVLNTTTSHEEGCERLWALMTKEFIGDGKGNLASAKVVEMGWSDPEPGKKPSWSEIEGTERIVPCNLALLAIGFLHPQHTGMLDDLGVEYDQRGNVQAGKNYQTNNPKVFTAGDMRRGQSLVVWAISEGREAAYHVDEYLMGESLLEKKDESKLTI